MATLGYSWHPWIFIKNAMPHSLRLGTKKGQCKFWEQRISMICLCSKYVKNCNIFGQIRNNWAKLILKKIFKLFFQCLALPKDPQSFGSQNLRCPFLVSQYYRCQRLCGSCLWIWFAGIRLWIQKAFLLLCFSHPMTKISIWKCGFFLPFNEENVLPFL